MDCIVHGVAKSWTRLSGFHFHGQGKADAHHFLILAWGCKQLPAPPSCHMDSPHGKGLGATSREQLGKNWRVQPGSTPGTECGLQPHKLGHCSFPGWTSDETPSPANTQTAAYEPLSKGLSRAQTPEPHRLREQGCAAEADKYVVITKENIRSTLDSEITRSPGEGNGDPLQLSCLENPHRLRSLAGYSPWGCKEWTRPSDFHFTSLDFMEITQEKAVILGQTHSPGHEY